MTPEEIMAAHAKYVEDSLDSMESDLKQAVTLASIALIAYLVSKGLIVDGRLEATPETLQVISTVPAELDAALKKFGMDEILSVFAAEFDRQEQYFALLMEAIGVAVPKKSVEQDEYLTQRRVASISALLAIAFYVTEQVRFSATLSVGSPFVESQSVMLKALEQLPSKIKDAAKVEVFSHYRAIANMAYASLEQDARVRYRYAGPPAYDPVIRKFCKHLMQQVTSGVRWTREEIDRMDNGQLPNVMETCGGYECRHQWIPDSMK